MFTPDQLADGAGSPTCSRKASSYRVGHRIFSVELTGKPSTFCALRHVSGKAVRPFTIAPAGNKLILAGSPTRNERTTGVGILLVRCHHLRRRTRR